MKKKSNKLKNKKVMKKAATLLAQIEAEKIAQEQINKQNELALEAENKVEKRGGFTLNQLFEMQNQKQRFFTKGGKRNLSLKEEKDIDIAAMKQYYDTCIS